jgi:CAAX prenyl protease-like protein
VLLSITLLCRTFGQAFDDTYPLRMLVVGIPLWIYRKTYSDWKLSLSWMAVGVGLLAFVLWLALEPPWSEKADESPLAALPYSMAIIWLVVRVCGSSTLVPLVEELAFKGFLLRRLVSQQFESVPFTRFTFISFAGSTLVFGVMHQRWLAACLAGALYTLLLYRRGNLWDAIQAHAVTNFCLGAYAIGTGHWSLWI